MARKPNYRFERQERERRKVEKKAARQAKREQRNAETLTVPDELTPTPVTDADNKNDD